MRTLLTWNRWWVHGLFALVCACTFNPSGVAPEDGGPDTMSGDTDASLHLLITEVGLLPMGSDFIEIYNPGSEVVALGNYYLADNSDYALLPGRFSDEPQGPADLANSDFIVKFPDGAQIGPGEVKVIAINATEFAPAHGTPDFYLTLGDEEESEPMVDPADAFLNIGAAINGFGEGIVLFYWDGLSDLVSDVDMVHAGNPLESNRLGSKSGLEVDGPDTEEDEAGKKSRYRDEAGTLVLMDVSAPTGKSHKRIKLEDGFETRQVDGNGVFGDDETSEDLTQTWDSSATFTEPTPGEIPASLRSP